MLIKSGRLGERPEKTTGPIRLLLERLEHLIGKWVVEIIAEVVSQLRGLSGPRQREGARVGVSTGAIGPSTYRMTSPIVISPGALARK